MLALAFQLGGTGFRFIPEHVLARETDPVQPGAARCLDCVLRLVILGVLLIGEAVALLVVAVGAPQPWWGATVGVSLVVGAAGLVIPIVIAQINAIAEGRETGRAISDATASAVRALLGGGSLLVARRCRLRHHRAQPGECSQRRRARGQRSKPRAPAASWTHARSCRPRTAQRQRAAWDGHRADSVGEGTSVEKATDVTLVIGVSSSTTTTPDVLGMTLRAADRVLRKAGLVLGRVAPEPVDPAGRVRARRRPRPARGFVQARRSMSGCAEFRAGLAIRSRSRSPIWSAGFQRLRRVRRGSRLATEEKRARPAG